MINNINFTGSVFLAGSTKKLSPKKEVKRLQRYADKKDYDVVVYGRDYYAGGTGVYNTLLVKEDAHTGNNMFAKRTFDMKKPIRDEEVSFSYDI